MALVNLKVRATQLLRDSLAAGGWNPDVLVQEFREWKADGAAGEYGSYYFGKDAPYDPPRRNGKPVLWHVHMPPETDSEATAKWTVAWRRRTRKTSDAALIYAYDPLHGYLLLYFAVEPTAHALIAMRDADSRDLMNLLADIAEAFIHDGSIVV
jgi:hypothetical protein